jgi:hypothetical protein
MRTKPHSVAAFFAFEKAQNHFDLADVLGVSC